MAAINIDGRGKEPADGSNKRAKKLGMPPNIGNWEEAVSPIPDAFRPYLDSVPNTVTLKLTTGCQWDITISDVNGKACFDQGWAWAAFAVAHDLKIGYLLTFKKIYPKVYKVVIYDYSQVEVVKRCPKHPEAFKRIVE